METRLPKEILAEMYYKKINENNSPGMHYVLSWKNFQKIHLPESLKEKVKQIEKEMKETDTAISLKEKQRKELEEYIQKDYNILKKLENENKNYIYKDCWSGHIFPEPDCSDCETW
jgi:hypothetical protein